MVFKNCPKLFLYPKCCKYFGHLNPGCCEPKLSAVLSDSVQTVVILGLLTRLPFCQEILPRKEDIYYVSSRRLTLLLQQVACQVSSECRFFCRKLKRKKVQLRCRHWRNKTLLQSGAGASLDEALKDPKE